MAETVILTVFQKEVLLPYVSQRFLSLTDVAEQRFMQEFALTKEERGLNFKIKHTQL